MSAAKKKTKRLMNEMDNIILPISMKSFSQTISLDLVPVKSMESLNNDEELKVIKNEVKKENRDRKIDSIIEGKEFKESKVEDHPDFKKAPKSTLVYLDFKYDSKDNPK